MESPTPTDGEQINEITSELSYEEEQLQIIIMKELENQKIETERKIVQKQDDEYQSSLKQDLEKVTENVEFQEISIEEMRKIRLKRFSNV